MIKILAIFAITMAFVSPAFANNLGPNNGSNDIGDISISSL